jgi:hypothetical protein
LGAGLLALSGVIGVLLWNHKFVELWGVVAILIGTYYLGGATQDMRVVQNISIRNQSRTVSTDDIIWKDGTGQISFPKLNEKNSVWMVADDLKGTNAKPVTGSVFSLTGQTSATFKTVFIQYGDNSTSRATEIFPTK